MKQFYKLKIAINIKLEFFMNCMIEVNQTQLYDCVFNLKSSK